MTPEQARELLDGAQPGPWKAVDEDDNGKKRPDTSRLMRSASGEYLGIMHGQDAHLAAAAPDLAETIAEMHWEYAVQAMDEDGKWLGIDKNGLATHAHGFVVWHISQRDARESLLDLVEQEAPTRIVRRMVTDPEVVE